MPGETSKKIGDDGEDLARSFLERINWPICAQNIDIPCVLPKEHEVKATPPKHGIDFIVAYDCPLVHTTRRNILVSMKNSEVERTRNQTAKVKDDLKEISQAITCFRRSQEKSSINSVSERSRIEICGIVIKINKDKDAAESFLPTADEGIQLDLDPNSEVHFMENGRFDFVDRALAHLSGSFSGYSWNYSYPRNTINYAAEVAEIEGRIIPQQHLLGGPLTFRLRSTSNKPEADHLIIFSPDPFSDGNFSRLIGLANACTEGWAEKIRIVFPELSTEDKKKAEQISRGVKSVDFSRSISIDSFEQRSRLK